MSAEVNQAPEAVITADKELPKVGITREFDAEPELVFRAHIDPEIFARWIGPDRYQVTIDRWDGRTGGSYRYGTGEEWFFGSFHQIQPDKCRIVQTWSWESMPEAVSLETMIITSLPGGRSKMSSIALVDSMEAQAMMLASGMETGINQGYAKLDVLLDQGFDKPQEKS